MKEKKLEDFEFRLQRIVTLFEGKVQDPVIELRHAARNIPANFDQKAFMEKGQFAVTELRNHYKEAAIELRSWEPTGAEQIKVKFKMAQQLEKILNNKIASIEKVVNEVNQKVLAKQDAVESNQPVLNKKDIDSIYNDFLHEVSALKQKDIGAEQMRNEFHQIKIKYFNKLMSNPVHSAEIYAFREQAVIGMDSMINIIESEIAHRAKQTPPTNYVGMPSRENVPDDDYGFLPTSDDSPEGSYGKIPVSDDQPEGSYGAIPDTNSMQVQQLKDLVAKYEKKFDDDVGSLKSARQNKDLQNRIKKARATCRDGGTQLRKDLNEVLKDIDVVSQKDQAFVDRCRGEGLRDYLSDKRVELDAAINAVKDKKSKSDPVPSDSLNRSASTARRSKVTRLEKKYDEAMRKFTK